jgi:hypothetical protein
MARPGDNRLTVLRRVLDLNWPYLYKRDVTMVMIEPELARTECPHNK